MLCPCFRNEEKRLVCLAWTLLPLDKQLSPLKRFNRKDDRSYSGSNGMWTVHLISRTKQVASFTSLSCLLRDVDQLCNTHNIMKIVFRWGRINIQFIDEFHSLPNQTEMIKCKRSWTFPVYINNKTFRG